MIKHFAALILCSCSICAAAQVNNDFGVWTTVSYGFEVAKDLEFSVDQEFRLEENATRLGRAFTNLALNYELENWIRFRGNYRFILDRRGSRDIFGHRHRFMGDVILRTRQQRFTFNYRARLQWEVRGLNYNREFGFSPSWDLRHTAKVEYLLNRRYEPYFTVDLRFLMGDARTPYHTGFDRHRLVAGVNINLARNRRLDIFFLTDRDWNVVEPDQRFVLGFEYSFGGSRLLLGS